MKKKNGMCRKILSAGIICLLVHGTISAQEETGFDLSSQRSEVQNVLPVPGAKKKHRGFVLNPTPQRLVHHKELLDLKQGVRVDDRRDCFGDDLDFLPINRKGVRLRIDFGERVAAKNGVRNVSGAYSLSIEKKGISIVGFDERGAFYGLQTLRQLMAGKLGAEGKLPFLEINDFPDLPNRGVVEGFYGTPWSHKVRLSLIDFYGRQKMNTYLYGPKDDPYHSCPNWRLPYPEKEAENIRELIEACRRNRVDFVWAIHPGQDIKWNEEDYHNLLNKLGWMYELGVRHFALFFDDISGEGTNPLKQTELLNRLTVDFVEKKGDVSPLTVCPTDYSRLWANPTPQGSLAIYGETLQPDVKVFWTGDVVCSDLTRETMDWVNSRIRRPAYYWWNYPVTDYVRNIVLQGPVYGLDTTLTEQEVCGVVSNPMEHGEASKLGLYGVADYAWNVADYNAKDNWERGLAELVPEAKEAYRTFAIHSCDTETGYRRDESWETRTFRLSEWTDGMAERLEQEFSRVEQVPQEMEAGCKNQALLEELRPWLTEFGKLGIRGRKALELGRMYRSGQNDSVFWCEYVGNLMSAEDRKAYEAHKSGTMKLQPFYEYMMDDMAHGFLKKLTGKIPTDYRGIGSFGNSGTILTKLMLDNDSTTHYTSGAAQKDGDWIGVDLRTIRPVREVFILQGRNSVDDVDFFDHVALECSEDGKTWHTLLGDLKNQYVIVWKGEPVDARYVRLKRLDSKRKNYAAVRVFNVNPIHPETLEFRLEATDMQQALRAFDRNPATAGMLQGRLAFEVQPEVHSYVMLLKDWKEPVVCKLLDAKGKVVTRMELDAAFVRIQIPEDRVTELVLEGSAEIVEIVAE